MIRQLKRLSTQHVRNALTQILNKNASKSKQPMAVQYSVRWSPMSESYVIEGHQSMATLRGVRLSLAASSPDKATLCISAAQATKPRTRT